MQIRKTIVYILAMLPTLCLATQTQLLTQIKNSLDSTPGTPSHWGYAHVLSDVGNITPQPTDMSTYWTGEFVFKSSTSRIDFIQLVHDTLLGFPHLDYNINTPDENNTKRVFNLAHLAALKTSASQPLQTTAYRTIYNVKNSSTTVEAYLALSKLVQRSQNCLDYWETKASNKKVDAVLERGVFAGEILATSDCNKPLCSTDSNRPYNGFYDISRQAVATRTLLSSINCTHASITTGIHAGGKRKMCQLLHNLLTEDTSLRSPPSVTGADLPLSAGENYLSNIIANTPEILKVLKIITLLQIDERITTPGLTIQSISSIYQPPSPATPAACQSGSNALVPSSNSGKCTDSSYAYTPDEPTTLYVSQLLGLGSIDCVIEPGLPLGLPDHYALIAGNYLGFTRFSSSGSGATATITYRAIDSAQAALPAPQRYAVYMNTSGLNKIANYRQELTTKFYKQRAKKQNAAINLLFRKSTALEIISDIRGQNERILSFQNNTNTYRTSQLTLLSDSAAWRLEPGNASWMDSLASSDNDSLLREIALLLAEIKHIQYHLFATRLKSTLFSAIIIAKSTNFANLDAFLKSMDLDRTAVLSGGCGDNPIAPMNSAALQNRNAGAAASVRAAAASTSPP